MRTQSIALLELALVLAVATVLAVACSPSPPEPESTTGGTPAASSDDDHYTVRGLVVEILERPDGWVLRIQHEAIPDFRGMDGEVWDGGMESMTMNFAVADGVTLGDIAAGDKVEFTLVVDWAKKPTQWITEIVTLAEETELDFGTPAESAG